MFGAFLKTLRKSKNVTQRQLAEALSVDHTYISKIENGAYPVPSAETVRKIAEHLNACEYEALCAAGFCVHCKGTGKAIKCEGSSDATD